MVNSSELDCPVCTLKLNSPPKSVRNDFTYYDCQNCGPYELSRELRLDGVDDASRPKVSHYIRFCDSAPRLLQKDVEHISQNPSPSIHEQANNLVIFLVKHHKPGEMVRIESRIHQAAMGSSNCNAGILVTEYLTNNGLFTPTGELSQTSEGYWAISGRLSADGYAYYDEIVRGHITSNVVFMAMPFGNEILDSIYLDQLKPAVKETGFDLTRLDERPEMGIIDNHMELAIRKSKFVIAELTNRNPGAYWEAGFAEGMSKPVIYMCERGVFEDKKTHFDTNHRQTVVWSEATIAEDMDRLKTIIRVKFPGEAILAD